MFTPDHIDAVVVVRGRHIRIVNPDPVDRQRAFGVALQKLANGKPTRDWQEQAFSEAHGWPICVTVHQERLVIGGSRDVPDRLWFSKTGHPFNFDPGTGLDDEAISFRLAGDEQHAIRGLLPGRLLQVFTTSGEWIVRGAPVTPESVAVELQTRIGSWTGRRLDPSRSTVPLCSSAPRAESCASSSMPRASKPIRLRTSPCSPATSWSSLPACGSIGAAAGC